MYPLFLTFSFWLFPFTFETFLPLTFARFFFFFFFYFASSASPIAKIIFEVFLMQIFTSAYLHQ
jgi:hypothetical protein